MRCRHIKDYYKMTRCISPLMIVRSGTREVVPCGKCNFCLETKRSDWTFRILQEVKIAESAYFLTLTYDDVNIPRSSADLPSLCKRDVQLFHKRLRKLNEKSGAMAIRYYTVGEYGTRTLRPHYHSIMFNLAPLAVKKLLDVWSLGFVHVGEVNIASIHYVTKYVINKVGKYQGREPPFAFMSRRPGLGANYISSHRRWHRQQLKNFTKVHGVLGRLPRFYKDKFFSAIEKAKLASQAIELGDENYLREVDRLSRFHQDPSAYYDECIRRQHDAVTYKVNSLNKF